jgi:N-acetylglucosaminyldiphosphoundecaprenol N-acetyl-beta-D-mannosaminyltransferase
MNIINILGINISTLNKQQTLEKLNQFLTASGQHQIVTPNPEILLQAGHDEEFFYILNKVDLAIPDGIGLKFAGWLAGKNIRRITGADLVKDILKIAQEKNLKVAVVNWSGGLSKKEDIEKVLEKKYPDLKFLVEDIEREERAEQIASQNFQPDVLLVALGAPWQEKFIYHNLSQLPSVKIGIGVGGAFDFLTGRIKRAPKIMRVIGLEWLWRLFMQPWRWRRIYNAVIIFPWKFFKWKFVLTFLYRPNVSCVLYKKDGNRTKILLVERKDDQGHWQLPQGGTDGEDLETAGSRELCEELGTDKFKAVASYKNLWKYEFGDKLSKFGVYARLVMGYKGQKQGLFIAEFTGNDSDIKINFWEHINWKWVDSENLVNEVHQVRKEAAKIFLEKFYEI